LLLKPMTAREVLDGCPEARTWPYGLRVHKGGLATKAGKTAWVHAVPNEDGSWTATGWLGQFGDTRGRVLVTERLTGPDALYSYFADAVPDEPRDMAMEIVSAVSETERLTRMAATYLPLTDRVPGLEITSAGGACPFQAEGTLLGMPFYFRYRSAHATLRVGEDLFDKSLYSAGMEFGDDDLQGWLEEDEFMSLMVTLIGDLERAPIAWEFPGVEPNEFPPPARPAGSPTTHRAWGHTADEAWERLNTPNPYLLARGWTEERARAQIAAMGLVNAALTVDDREFPLPEPDWANLVAPAGTVAQ
jgi:hypothetical protein